MSTDKKTKKISQSGFTLIEVVVSIGIFATVFISVSGAFISVMDAYQKVVATRTNVDNLSTAMESMVRGIKTGGNYHCGSTGDITLPQNCPAGGTYLAFVNVNVPRPFGNPNTVPIVYRFLNGRIERSDSGGSVGSFYPITVGPPELVINTFNFYVIGATPMLVGETLPIADVIQPQVTIVIKGTMGRKNNVRVPINLETMITQRRLDYQ